MPKLTKDTFEAKMFKEPNTGCWLSFGKSPYGPTKLAYRLFKGKIKNGMDIMHSCDTPACVNPDHLSLGTREDNVRDCIKKGRLKTRGTEHLSKRTHCDNGHPYNEENTYIENKNGKFYQRRCRICRKRQNSGLRNRKP